MYINLYTGFIFYLKINTLTTVNILQKYYDLANSESNATQHNM